MELKLGKISNLELSQWFGITLKSYTNSRKKYLKKLEIFCKFKELRGGVEVEEIYYSKYIKDMNIVMNKIYLELVKAEEYHITFISGMAKLLKQRQDYKEISYSGLIKLLTKAGNIGFGPTKEENSQGEFGSREYVWAIKLYDRPNHYRPLTYEENELFDEMLSGYYTANPEKIKKAALLEEAFREDETMTKEEYFKQKEILGLDMFYQVIKLFKTKTNLQVVKATWHDVYSQYLDSCFNF